MKKTKLLIVLIAILLSSLLMAADDIPLDKVRITVRNQTGAPVGIRMDGGKSFFYVVAQPGESTFSVDRRVYALEFSGCGQGGAAKTLDFHTVFKINIPKCIGGASHSGEVNMQTIPLK
jgi:hypothetical protein